MILGIDTPYVSFLIRFFLTGKNRWHSFSNLLVSQTTNFNDLSVNNITIAGSALINSTGEFTTDGDAIFNGDVRFGSASVSGILNVPTINVDRITAKDINAASAVIGGVEID